MGTVSITFEHGTCYIVPSQLKEKVDPSTMNDKGIGLESLSSLFWRDAMCFLVGFHGHVHLGNPLPVSLYSLLPTPSSLLPPLLFHAMDLFGILAC